MRPMNIRTKIVVTIGPQNAGSGSLKTLYDAGMSVVRLNGSHNSFDWHAETILRVKHDLPDVPIIFDLPGRKIRTQRIEEPLVVNEGGFITLTTAKDSKERGVVLIDSSNLHEKVSLGQDIFADDGTLKFRVERVEGQNIVLRSRSNGFLGNNKGINIPKLDMGPVVLTDVDKDFLEFARKLEIDFIGLSFVESRDHVELYRDYFKSGWTPKIISKIENYSGFQNLEDIVCSSDGIMIDRGDLSVETDLESVILRQKVICRTGNRLSKPVIVATEMLHTMINFPTPTKAEVGDVTNAVLDGCAATMLSGETAVGRFPVESVQMMQGIIAHTENFFENETRKLGQKTAEDDENNHEVTIAKAIDLICRSIQVTKIVAITRNGHAARSLSSLGGTVPIIGVSDIEANSRSFNLYKGVLGVHFPAKFASVDVSHVPAVLKFLWDSGLIISTDRILVTALAYPVSGNRMNLIETHIVSDLVSALKW